MTDNERWPAQGDGAMRGLVVGTEGVDVEVEGSGSLDVYEGGGWCGFLVAPRSLSLCIHPVTRR